MNKPIYHPPLLYPTTAGAIISTFPAIPVGTALETARRLIVLIPANTDYNATTRRIQEIARASGRNVLLLGLCEDAAGEFSLRRELVTTASLLRNERICAEATVHIGTSWIDPLKTNYQTGDIIVCLADERTGFLQRPLSQILTSKLKATVYILSELAPREFKANRLSQIIAWLGFIVTILGSGLLQARIVRLPGGWLQSILLILAIVLEFGLIWVWNGWFQEYLRR